MDLDNLPININQYTDLKNQGVINYNVKGDQVFIIQKRFDPNTGDASPDRITQVPLSDIQAKITDLQSQLDNYNAMLSDANMAISAATNKVV